MQGVNLKRKKILLQGFQAGRAPGKSGDDQREKALSIFGPGLAFVSVQTEKGV